jgi:cytochrome c
MDFLKDLALPQSTEHYHLVVLLAAISSMVFIPYVTFVLGSTVMSLWYERRGRAEQNKLFISFARTLSEIALYSKSLVGFLAIIPGLSLVFSYAQMVQGTPALSVGVAGFGFIFLLAGCILLYSHKYTFHVQEILDKYRGLAGKVHSDDSSLDEYEAGNARVHFPSGTYGVIFLAISVFLYGAAVRITADPTSWSSIDSLFALLLSGTAWLQFLLLLSLSAGVTGIGILFFTFGWTDMVANAGENYRVLARKVAGKLIVVSLITMPVFLLAGLGMASGVSLSGPMFGLIGGALLFFFLAAHFVYGFIRTKSVDSVSYGLFTFLVAAVLIVLSDHVAIGSATKSHAATLAFAHDKATEELKVKLGVGLPSMTGAEIYDAKCSACHLFDTKKVGPPYNVVLKKYLGKKAEMVAFVLNPVKVDPAFPSMPGQGLRPAEADSIVSFLLAKYASTHGK